MHYHSFLRLTYLLHFEVPVGMFELKGWHQAAKYG